MNVYLELLEGFLGALPLTDFEYVEPHSLGQRPALSYGHDVSKLHISEM